MKRHVDSVHENKKPHKCPICDFTSSQKSTMNIHTASVHEKKRPHKCSICDQSFPKNSKSKRHVESVHEEKQSAHLCSVCDKSFSAKDKLKRHTNSVYIEKSSLLVRFSYSIVNRKSSSLFGLHIVKIIRTWMPWWLVNVSGHRLYMMCRLLKSKLKKPLWVHSIHTLHITCYHKLTITTSLLMFTIEKTKSFFFISFFLFIHEEVIIKKFEIP